jgi:hypothetical protein
MDPHTGRRGANLLYLDTAAVRPAAGEVALRLPVVLDDTGAPVDQAANVAWLLDHLGRPGYDVPACADVLVARGYSSPGLRRADGAHAAWPRHDGAGHSLAGKIIASVTRHLEVYETGIWTIERTDADPIRITDMLPASGRWLSAERSAEIRGYLAELASTRRRPRVCTFSGHPAQVGSVSARLWARRRSDGQVVYHLRAPRARRTPEELRAAPLPPIGAIELAASIAEGLATAAEHLTPLVDAGAVARADRDAAELARLEHRLAELQEANRRRLPLLDAGDSAFEPSAAVRRALRDRVDRDIAAIAEVDTQLRARRRQAAADAAHTGSGVPIDGLLTFVASLRDPYADTFRPALRAALSPLQITPDNPPIPAPDDPPGPRSGHRSRRPAATAVTWSAQQVLHENGESYAVPISGRTQPAPTGAPVPIDDRVQAAVAGLRAGITLPDSDGPNWRRVLPGVRAALAVDGVFHLGSVTKNAYAVAGVITATVALLHWMSADSAGDGPAPRF